MRLIDAGWQVGAGCWQGLQSAAQGLSTGRLEWPQHLAWFPPEQVNQGSKEEAARPFMTQARKSHTHPQYSLGHTCQPPSLGEGRNTRRLGF